MVQSTCSCPSAAIRSRSFVTEELVMHTALKYVAALSSCAALAATIAFAADAPAKKPAQDKYTVKVPGGLAFSEFKGYESWQVVAVSHNEKAIAVILGNPAMIKAYEAGIPANGKPVPDGAKMAKVHWVPKKNKYFPDATVPGEQHDVDFMAKDSKRFGDVGGWGYGAFRYDTVTDTFTPATTADQPPQANDAKCGVACHTLAKSTDYVFTEYGHR
jgi:Cytochrome P460